MRYERLKGLIAAPFTAFHPDGKLNPELIPRQADSLAANGVAGAFVCGTTGEGPSLTTAERKDVAERWIAAAAGRLRVIVHVGHACLEECRALAAHAEGAGAWGIGCVAPFFFKPRGVSDLVEFCARVASAAPRLPFYYYHLPSVTGVGFAMSEFLPLAARRIPNLAGIKYTHEDLMDYSACLRFDGGRFDIVFGRDEILLAGLSLGAQGAIGSTYNYCAPAYVRLMAAFERGDLAEARAEQAKAADVVAAMLNAGGMPAGKAIMGLIGLDCGPVRPPLRPMDVDGIEGLRRALDRLDFSRFASQV